MLSKKVYLRKALSWRHTNVSTRPCSELRKKIYLFREVLFEELGRYVRVGRVVAEVRLQANSHHLQYVLVVDIFQCAAPGRDVLAQLKVIVLSSEVIAAGKTIQWNLLQILNFDFTYLTPNECTVDQNVRVGFVFKSVVKL